MGISPETAELAMKMKREWEAAYPQAKALSTPTSDEEE